MPEVIVARIHEFEAQNLWVLANSWRAKIDATEDMAMKTLITNELFLDFIECKYRGYLKITGATEPQSDLLDVSVRLSAAYHRQAREHLLRSYRDEGKQEIGRAHV